MSSKFRSSPRAPLAGRHSAAAFSLRELLARIRALLHRQEVGRAASLRDAERGRYRGGWQLDRRSRRLTDPGGTEVPLTKGEYALLTAFLDAPQRSLSLEQLLEATTPARFPGTSRVV